MKTIERYVDGVLHIKVEFTEEELAEKKKLAEESKARREEYLKKRNQSNYNKDLT